jgi:zinc-ribbon domain
MSNNAISRPVRVCPACGSPLAEAARFCSSCGARAVDPSVLSTVDAYINKQLDQEVAKRFTDQSSIAREIGDKAEDVVWKRLRLFTVLLVSLLALVGIAGYKTVNDVTQSIEKETAGKVDAVKLRLDELSQDVEAQTKRVTERGGDISNRLAQLDKTANEAQARVELYLKRADELSEQMAKRITELDTKVAQVSTQVDRVSVSKSIQI